jgi:hypothetical protein
LPVCALRGNDEYFAHDACPDGQMMLSFGQMMLPSAMMTFALLTNTADFIISSISPAGTASLAKRHHFIISEASSFLSKPLSDFLLNFVLTTSRLF